MTEHLPGSVDTPITPGGGYDATLAQTTFDEIYNIASNVEEKISNSVISTLADVERVCANIQSTFLGTAGITLDDVDRVCAKIAEKISRGMTATMTDVYTYMVQAGFPVPTMQQVRYANATGDFIGSMVSPETLTGGSGNDLSPTASSLPAMPARGIEQPIAVPPTFIPGSIPSPVPLTPPALIVNPVAPLPPAIAPVGQINSPPTADNPPFLPLPPIHNGPCPAGSIAVAFQPGGPVRCYPGSLPPNIGTADRPFYGYNPANGDPYTQDGRTCGPLGTDMGCWGPGAPPIVPVSNPPPQPSQACPPGTHLEMVPSGPALLEEVLPIQVISPTYTALGQPCNKRFGPPPSNQWPYGYPGAFNYFPVFTPAPYTGATNPPDTKRNYDVVYARHWVNDPPDQGWQYFAVTVPSEYVLWADAESGYVFSSPTVPGFGCPIEETKRQRWRGGEMVPQCVVDTPAPSASCPNPSLLDCPPPYKSPTLPKADGKDPCEQIKAAVDKLGTDAPKVSDVITFMGDVAGTNNPGVDSILRAIMGSPQPVLPALVKRFADWCQKVVSDSSQGFDCDRSKLLPLAINRAIFSFIDKWTGIIPDQLTTELRQLTNTVCQSELPTANEADRGWLKDSITDEEWECYTKAEGRFVGPAKKLRDGERAKPEIHQVLQLYMREYLNDDETKKRLRALGVTNDADKAAFGQLMEQWPTFSDLIRFMVRDVFNEQTVEDAKMDQGFDANYTEKAKKYGRAAGVPDELAKYFWRAHWQIPSFTMLREMLFRLRPAEYPADMAVSQDVMRKALAQDDWAPGFIDRMIEISYHTITRTDGILMYMMHTIDDDKFIGILQSDGYKEKDARTIQEHYKVKRRINDYLKAGYPTLKQAVTLYSKCQIDSSTLDDIIGKLSTSDDQANAARDAAELARHVWERKQAVTTVQREYRLGLLSDTEATSELSARGIDPGCVPGFVRAMKKNRQQTSKYLTAAQLCKMRQLGLVTDTDQMQALLRQGWDSSDAARIVVQCDLEMSATASKEAQKKAAAAQKQAAADAKAATKAAKPKAGQ